MIWFSEAYRWPDGSTWLGILNPTTMAQEVRVTVLGRDVVRTVTVPARGRVAQELGAWGVSGDFGLEVRCDTVCAAALTMWNRQMTVAHESVPMVGCEAPI